MEKEFERFAADLTGMRTKEPIADARRPAAGSRGPQPAITAEYICERALELVERDGIDALTLRHLAVELKISTRTLYKRIGSRARLIRALVEMHLGRLNLEFQPGETWEASMWAWCGQLHQALTEHPQLTSMSQGRTLASVAPHVEALIETSVLDGVPRDVAAECCWSVADLTINDAMAAARASALLSAAQTAARPIEPSKTFTDAIKWILRGVGAEAGSAPAAEVES